jgi:hypothetical protein
MAMNINLSAEQISFTEIINEKNQLIERLKRDVLRLGGGERCPQCSDWVDITDETLPTCIICGGLGYYLPYIEGE